MRIGRLLSAFFWIMVDADFELRMVSDGFQWVG